MSHDAAQRVEADAKRFASLQARAALRGFSLRPIANGGDVPASYLLSRWGLTIELCDLDATERAVDRACGAEAGPVSVE